MFRSIVVIALVLVTHRAGCSAQAQHFGGVYAVRSSTGPMRLTLIQQADAIGGTLISGSVTFEVDGAVVTDADEGDTSVEGRLFGPQGGGEFSFFGDGTDDGFILLITPHDATGEPRYDLAATYVAQREEYSGAVADFDPTISKGAEPPEGRLEPAAPVVPDVALDPQLVGYWSTQVILNSEIGSISTQLFLEFRADGIMTDHGARSIGSVGDSGIDTGYEGAGESVYWQTQGDILQVSYDRLAWVGLARFEVDATRLFLAYYDGDQKIWYRR